MGLFDKKTAAAPSQNQPDLSSPPTEKIMVMRSQGLSNNQIIQNLQREGYDSDKVFKAMNLADISAGIDSQPITDEDTDWPPSPDTLQNPMQFQAIDKGFGQEPMMKTGAPIQGSFQDAQFPGQGPPPLQRQQMPMQNMPPPMEGMFSGGSGAGNLPPMMPPSQENMSIERIEEITEAIIDEKWDEIVKSINKIIDWKDRTENKIVQLEQKFNDIKKDFENLSQGVLGKVGEYDKNLSDIGVEIRAMEKVFQKMIPDLTENVHALGKITKDLRVSAKRDMLSSDEEDKSS